MAYNSFDCEVDFIRGVYVSVEVLNGIATCRKASTLSKFELETVRKYVRYHCERMKIPLTMIVF